MDLCRFAVIVVVNMDISLDRFVGELDVLKPCFLLALAMNFRRVNIGTPMAEGAARGSNLVQ